MNPIKRLWLILTLVMLAACSREPYIMQAEVREMGDAMEHCKGFMKHLLPDDAQIHIDDRSSRETVEHYDVYFKLYDAKQEGWSMCRVNMAGLITYQAVHEFRQKGRSFVID